MYAKLLKNHSASSKAIFKYVVDHLTDEGAIEIQKRLADGWALALTTTITTPPTIFGTISKPGQPIEEVFRIELTQAIDN